MNTHGKFPNLMGVTNFPALVPLLLLCTCALVISGCVQTHGDGVLLKTSTSWDGGRIAYPVGDPEVTSVILKIAAGEQTPFHCHPVPTLGYVLKGIAEVETHSGKKIVLEPGDAAVEVMRTAHRGRALSGDVEILVFYAGASAVPNTVFPADDPGHEYCAP